MPQLRVGQIVQDRGSFKFPAGNRILEVSEDIDGNTCIAVLAQSSVVWYIPYTKISYRTAAHRSIEHQVVVEPERDWFVAVDRYDRLWVYYGRCDRDWGPKPELPGGGTRPYGPAVVMQGLSFLEAGGLATGGQIVTDSDQWAGVPARFLEEVRDASKLDTDSQWVLPAEAPTFTPKQQDQLTRRLNRSR